MKTALILCALLIAMPVWAGTFRDDFEGGDMEGWTKLGEGRCLVENGVLILEMFEKDVKGTLAKCGDETWKVDTLAFDLKVKKQEYYFTCDMRLQIRDDGTMPRMDCIFVDNAPAEKLVMACVDNDDGLDEDTQCMAKVFPLTIDKWYKIKAIVDKSIFKVFIDDENILFVNMRNKPIPESGLIDFWTAGAGEYHLDNIIVTGAGVPNTGPSGMNSPFFVGFNDKLTTAWGSIKQ